MSAPLTFDESRALAFALTDVADRARADFAAAVAEFGLPVAAARVLIGLEEPTPLRGIAAELRCDPGYLTTMADRLEKEGWAERVPGPNRRTKCLRATPAGEELRDRMRRTVRGRALFGRSLTPDQRETLTELLAILQEEQAGAGS